MLGLIKKVLSSIVNASKYTKCVSLSNQKCQIQSSLINLHPNEHSQAFHYYPFPLNLMDALEAVILLMTYLIKYAFQIKQKI